MRWCLQWVCYLPVLSSSPSSLPSVSDFGPWAPLSCHWKPMPPHFSWEGKPLKALLVDTPVAPYFLCVQGAQASLRMHGASGEGTCLIVSPQLILLLFSCVWLHALGFSEQQVITAVIKKLSAEGEISLCQQVAELVCQQSPQNEG